MRRWLLRIGFALLALFVLALIAAWIAMRASLPAMDGTLVLRGLAAPVTVRRDARGVVTIEADNERDAIRALGYVHAPEDLLDRTPAFVEAAALSAEGAASVLTFGDVDPDLFADVEPSRAARASPRRWREIKIDQTARLAHAWTVIACPAAIARSMIAVISRMGPNANGSCVSDASRNARASPTLR